jgi:hypothetical protein
VVAVILLAVGFNVPDMPKGDLTADAPDDSIGDCDLAVVVGEEERPWLVFGKPRFKCSDLALDIIDYLSGPRSRGGNLYVVVLSTKVDEV